MEGGCTGSLPKTRWFVDKGSLLYVDVMNKVLVMSFEEHAMVPIAVRQQTLECMPSVDRQVRALNILAHVDRNGAEEAKAVGGPVEGGRPIFTTSEAAVPTEVIWFPLTCMES